MADYMKSTSEGDPFLDFSRLTRDQAAALREVTVEDYLELPGIVVFSDAYFCHSRWRNPVRLSKSGLAQLGIRNFKPTLRKAPECPAF
jgi:hypothetical protein